MSMSHGRGSQAHGMMQVEAEPGSRGQGSLAQSIAAQPISCSLCALLMLSRSSEAALTVAATTGFLARLLLHFYTGPIWLFPVWNAGTGYSCTY